LLRTKRFLRATITAFLSLACAAHPVSSQPPTNGKMIFPLPLPMMKPILRILTKPATPARIPCVIIRAKIGTRLMTCPMRPSPQATRHRSRQRLHHERRLE
jgi:hypothetical protein